MFSNRNAQRAAALVAMWLVLYVLGLNGEQHTWALWSIFALALVLEFLAFTNGIVRGIEIYVNMSPEQQRDLQQIIKENE